MEYATIDDIKENGLNIPEARRMLTMAMENEYMVNPQFVAAIVDELESAQQEIKKWEKAASANIVHNNEPTLHELKLWPQYFSAVMNREKTFEIRKNDRNFKIGDVLLLKEYNSSAKRYTGRKVLRTITYITDYAQQDEYVVMGIE
jgi:Domain of unknown function (DUF3850)